MHLYRSFRCFVLLGYCTAAAPLSATTISLTPTHDNTLIQRQLITDPQLSNALGDVISGRTNQDGQGPATISIRRGLIYWDLSTASIPAGAVITGVDLRMRDVQGLNGDRATTLHRLTNSWGEGTSFQAGGQSAAATDNDATWFYRFYNTANPGASPAWSTPGGDFVSTPSATTVINDDLGPLQPVAWLGALNPQMVADVQDWLDNPVTNFGWLIKGVETSGQTAKRLNGNGSDVPPLLEITYTVVPEPTGVCLALSALLTGCLAVARRRGAGSR
ncbi:MAG: hypothetical protein K1X74_15530 [Pirellulales bacterium]|nr:hypothetical protein [Pirellulales bacterium]